MKEHVTPPHATAILTKCCQMEEQGEYRALCKLQLERLGTLTIKWTTATKDTQPVPLKRILNAANVLKKR